jgi:hypothetical protein
MKTIILGITGKARCGKDTFANRLVEEHGFVKVSFAEPLKRMLLNALLKNPPPFDCILDETEWRGQLWDRRTQFTRWLLQFVGTEIVRENFDPNFWIHEAFAVLERTTGNRFVFPDVRFANEVEAIRKRNGRIVRLHRLSETADENRIEYGKTHASETELDLIPGIDHLRIKDGVQNVHDMADMYAAVLGL